MTSEKKRIANRNNSRRSTGPRTDEGKKVSRWNAMRHGLLSYGAVIPGENIEEFEEFKTAVELEFGPAGPIETVLVGRIIDTAWRLRRLTRAETEMLHWQTCKAKAESLADQARRHEESMFDQSVTGFNFTVITDSAAHSKFVAEREALENECNSDSVMLGRAIDADARSGDALSKLAGYETRLERSLFRNLDQLQQMQERRRRSNMKTREEARENASDATLQQ